MMIFSLIIIFFLTNFLSSSISNLLNMSSTPNFDDNGFTDNFDEIKN